MSGALVTVFAVLGAVAGAVVLVPALRAIPEPWEPSRRAVIGVTVVNAGLWALAANKFSRGWVVLPFLVVFSVLLAVSIVDLRLYRIPDRFVFPALAITLALIIVGSFVVLPTAGDAFRAIRFAGTGLLAYFGILLLFHLLYPRGMGFGDVKLAALMGLGIGWLADSYFSAVYMVFVSLFVGCVLGIVFGLAWRVVQRQRGAFPFGPALATATVYVVLTFERYIGI